MLHHLATEHAVQRPIREVLQVGEYIRLFHVKAHAPATRNHLRGHIYSLCGNALAAQQRQELASSAATVQHIFPSFKVLEIEALPTLNILSRTPKSIFKQIVREGSQRCCIFVIPVNYTLNISCLPCQLFNLGQYLGTKRIEVSLYRVYSRLYLAVKRA